MKFMKITRQKDKVLLDIKGRRLIYPINTNFIHDLDSGLSKNWIKAGWDVENTIFLEIKYVTIPINKSSQIGTPSELFSGIVIFWKRQEYFRTVVFSKGLFDHHSDLVLRINAWHEKQHLTHMEEYMHNGTKVLTEDEVVEKEVEYVLETFGEEGFEARKDGVLADEERLKNSDAMPGFLTIPWLKEYFGKYYRKYANAILSIPPTEYAKTLYQNHWAAAQNSMRVYDMLGEDVSVLFKYTLQDIEL